MSKRKREEDTPEYESFPLIPSVTPSQDSQCENDAVHQIAERALLSAQFSDMTLLCRDGVLYAHKLIVCPQSEYFGRACSSRLKDATEPFQFLDKEPALMRKVLEYLYTGDYTLDFQESTGHSKGHPPSQGGSAKGQPDVVLPSESSIEPSKLRLIVHESSTTVAGQGLEMGKRLCEPSTGSTQSAVSASVNLDAGEGSGEEGSDHDFAAFCIANPAYFHVRMFAEADYFLIDGLKQTSKRLLRRSLVSSIQKEITIHEAIEELYSNRCDYRELKEVAILKLVKILRDPMIKNDSLVSSKIGQFIPDFALDLCTALMKVADQPNVPRTRWAGSAIQRSS
ncbi:hypothetical protein PMG11_01585 [Penicillium brasilianum]|uniref:BTB domain-containing protein n=1 Tax=Penicillium brasilianum TaxID=104259 RepID=A0A0F7TIJ7_PENBI|nr:hypothetical protein PMG11_01585 [Penicillium brasilianum]